MTTIYEMTREVNDECETILRGEAGNSQHENARHARHLTNVFIVFGYDSVTAKVKADGQVHIELD